MRDNIRNSLLDKSIDSNIFSTDDEISEFDQPIRKNSMKSRPSISKNLPPLGDVVFHHKRRSTASFAGSMISNLSIAIAQLYENSDRKVTEAEYQFDEDFREDISRMSFISISDRNLDDSESFKLE
mmetsp:Transcript_29270/g.32392  ORF Transcript_29270/g.32392 Transcript_29270/m.32392 type:complete len:126 (+) Transcript_29270:1-378(+)